MLSIGFFGGAPHGELVGHGIEDGNGFAVMVEQLLHTFQIAVLVILADGEDLSSRVRGDVLPGREPKELSSPCKVFVDGLAGSMLAGVCAAFKDPIAASLGLHLLQKGGGDVDAAALAGLLLLDGHPGGEAHTHKGQHIADAEAGSEGDAEGQAVGGHKCRQYVL